MPMQVALTLAASFALLCLAANLVACGEGSAAQAEGLPDANGNGARAPAYEGAFGDGAANCMASEAQLAALPHVTVGTTTLYGGYEQVSPLNQDPLFVRFDEGKRSYCRHHETEGPDSRIAGLSWDGGSYALVTFTTVGGGTALEGKPGWISSYAPGAISGGGPKVSYVARMRVDDGTIESGTFVIAVTSAGKVNSHAPAAEAIVLEDGTVEFRGKSAHKPIAADRKNSLDCGAGPFETRYRFSENLETLLCAESSDCTSTMPCN